MISPPGRAASLLIPRSRRRKKNPKPGTIGRRKHYANAKAKLIELLDSACAHCGETDPALLTFDHKNGIRDWEPRSVHATKRMRIYLQEARAGLGQLLCLSCNSAKQGSPEDDETF